MECADIRIHINRNVAFAYYKLETSPSSGFSQTHGLENWAQLTVLKSELDSRFFDPPTDLEGIDVLVRQLLILIR